MVAILCMYVCNTCRGYVVAQLVEALSYKPEGRRFDYQWKLFIDNPSGGTVVLGSTQSLTEMNITDGSWGKGSRCVELTTWSPSCAKCLEILGASNSWSPKGLSTTVVDSFALIHTYIYIYIYIYIYKHTRARIYLLHHLL